MMETVEKSRAREMICIVCPMGCRLRAEQDGNTIRVAGNTCPKGEKYAVEELTNPTRTVTSSIPVSGGHMVLLSVKTKRPVPKAAIAKVLKELQKAKATAPVAVGDVVLSNAAGTGVDVVATRSVRTSK